MIKKNIKIIFLVFILLFFTALVSEAQCPMCKLSAESNLKYGGSEGKGLNTGILYLFAAPYLLFGLIGYVYWKNTKRKSSEHQIEQEFDPE